MTEAQPCALYRHFDSAGTLLYVGISRDPIKRWSQHTRQSLWVQSGFVARVETAWYRDEKTARMFETAAIADEGPIFNKLRRSKSESSAHRRRTYMRAWSLCGSPPSYAGVAIRQAAVLFAWCETALA